MSLSSTERFENSLIIKLEDKKRKNAASRAVLKELLNHLDDAEKADEVLGVVITGVDNFFCAGADLKEAKDLNNFNDYVKFGRKVIDRIFNYKKPVIAALNGYAFGGGLEIALCCDLIYCVNNTEIGLPEVSLGMFPGWGGTQFLSRRIGPGLAKEIILTGKRISAEEAWEIGLVDKLFENETDLNWGSVKTIKQMFENCPQAVYKAKEMINLYYNYSLNKGLEMELNEFEEWMNKEYAKEGVNAFFEKRKPDWQ